MTNWSWRSRLLTIGVATVVLALIGVMQYQGRQNDEREQAREIEQVAEALKQLTPARVSYFVTGSATSVSLTVTTPTGMEQIEVSPPLVNTQGSEGLHFEFERGSFVSISAQNGGEYGDVTCRIEVAGETISENTSTSDYGIASCTGAVD